MKLMRAFVVGAIVFAISACLVVGTARSAAAGPPATQPSTAVDAYQHAATLLKSESPARSSLEYTTPPYPPAWHALARTAYAENAPARELVRQARTLPPGTWPAWQNTGDPTEPLLKTMNQCREVSVDLCDAALFAMHAGRQSEALDLLDDVGRLTDLLRGEPEPIGALLRHFVAAGFDTERSAHLLEIAPSLDLSAAVADRVDPKRLRAMIDALLRTPPAVAQRDAIGEINRYKAALVNETAHDPKADRRDAVDEKRHLLTINRVKMERAFAAVSLAAQLYRHDYRRWPDTVDALVPAYLPALPVDPFAAPPASIGYRVDKAALPDGSDRPLVFSRHESKDGLACTREGPLYNFYVGDGRADIEPVAVRKHVGQFRDLARWPAGK